MTYNKGGHTSADLDTRRVFQRSNYTASVKRMSDLYGVSCEQTYTGKHGADTPPFSASGATLWDEQPPLTFLVNPYEHDVTTDTGCSASAFFGSSEDGKPADATASKPVFGLRCDSDGTDSGTASATSDAALILRRNVSLAVGETVEFAFLYGYVVPPSTSRYNGGPEGRVSPTLRSLISKYSYGRTRGNEILVQNGELWRADIPSMEIENYPWVGREVAWNYAMTRQTLTFDSFFNENILDQGTGYRYDMGFQGAARDPLQHALPFILTDPNVTRSILRYTLKELHPPTKQIGDKVWNIPYFVIGHGIVGPPDPTAVVGARPSDEELYLLYTATEYVLTTKDVDFLTETVRAYNSTLSRTVLRCLVDSYEYVTRHIGVGSHGILRMQTGDWNDVFVQEAMNGGSTRAEVIASGESSTNAAMAAAILPRFAEMLELAAKMTGDHQYQNLTAGVRQFAANQAAALKTFAWNGEWLNRAWIPLPHNSSASDPGAKQFPGGWACTNGVDDRLCLEPQPWAIMASTHRGSNNGSDSAAVLDAAQTATLIEAMRTKLGSPLGSTVLSKPFARTADSAKAKVGTGGADSSRSGDAADAGQHENGGVWASQNHPLVLALASVNATAALDEWLRNTRVTQAQLYPTYWPGVWSGADVVTSHLSTDGQAGTQSWPAMPVLCTHPHSWPVYSSSKLAGLTFEGRGMRVVPAVPMMAGNYRYSTRVAGVQRIHHRKQGRVEYIGRYEPVRAVDECVVWLDLRVAHPELLAPPVRGTSPVMATVRLSIEGKAAVAGATPLEEQVQVVGGELELNAGGLRCEPGVSLAFSVGLDLDLTSIVSNRK